MSTKVYTDPSNRQAAQATISRQSWWMTTGRVMAGFIVLYLVLQISLTLLIPRLGQNLSTIISALTMLVLAVGCERLFFMHRPLDALRQLGYGRPGWRAVVVGLAISGVMLLFFPILTMVTGTPLRLNANWLPTLAGIILLNGLAEETLFRGYVFGHLRQNRTFIRAGLISLLFFAAAHLYLFIANPFIIALVGTIVAVTAALPMAFLFERGNYTIWAPVISHIAVHAIRLVAIPEPIYMPAVMAWLVLQIFLPLLVFVIYKFLKD